MKDWKSKFKKRTVNTDDFGKGGLYPKPMSLDSLVGQEECNNEFGADTTQKQKGSYLDRIFDDSFSECNSDNAHEEIIESEETLDQELPNIMDENAVFVDKAGKTEELISTIADKGHLDIQDLRNFTAYRREQQKGPLKIQDSPIVETFFQDVGDRCVVGVFQEYRLSLRTAYLGLASLFASVISSFFAFTKYDSYLNPFYKEIINAEMFFGFFLVLTIGLFVMALVAYYKKTFLIIGLDEENNAYFYAKEGLRNIKPEQVVSYEFFYHEHGYGPNIRYPFLHLEILTSTSRRFMLSGQVPLGCNNYCNALDKQILFAENFQALGGAFVIEQMVKFLRKAQDCKEVLE
jgi:hypothetical protein